MDIACLLSLLQNESMSARKDMKTSEGGNNMTENALGL